jgi:hypothetical protein
MECRAGATQTALISPFALVRGVGLRAIAFVGGPSGKCERARFSDRARFRGTALCQFWFLVRSGGVGDPRVVELEQVVGRCSRASPTACGGLESRRT